MWIGDEPVAVIDWTITSGTPVLHFVHTDHQGGGNMQRRMIIDRNWKDSPLILLPNAA